MPLQHRFFCIPARDPDLAQEEYNRFLKTIVASEIRSEFVLEGKNSYWSVSVEYAVDLKAKPESESWPSGKDYKDILSPEDFDLYLKLKTWRKQVAAAEKITLYNIFSNEQLAVIAEKRVATKAGLKKIKGVGEAKVRQYGDAVIELVNRHEPEAKPEQGESDETKEIEGWEPEENGAGEMLVKEVRRGRENEKETENRHGKTGRYDMFDEKGK